MFTPKISPLHFSKTFQPIIIKLHRGVDVTLAINLSFLILCMGGDFPVGVAWGPF